jgi:hypothetical protein
MNKAFDDPGSLPRPTAADERWPLVVTVAELVQAIREGLAAHHRYEALVAAGVRPQRALGITSADIFRMV